MLKELQLKQKIWFLQENCQEIMDSTTPGPGIPSTCTDHGPTRKNLDKETRKIQRHYLGSETGYREQTWKVKVNKKKQ